MRIAESSLVLQSTRAAVSYDRERTSVTVRRAAEQPPTSPALPPAPPSEDRLEISSADPAGEELGKDLDLKSWIAKILLQAFRGTDDDRPGVRRARGHEHAPGQTGEAPPARGRPGVEVEIHSERIRYEAESVHVAAGGTVTTGDGRTIDLAVQLDMQREHFERTTVDLRAGGDGRPVKDPLVINLAGGAAQLGGPRMAFDLDADGRTEQIATPSGGSRFLAIDRNGDGAVNDGRELFGPQTGNGFAELALLDDDHDGWIDEDDAGWGRLRIWDTTTGGLQTLAQAGVGAISTASVASDFALGQTAATADGFVRSTGVFLGEHGGAGTVQHVDLVV